MPLPMVHLLVANSIKCEKVNKTAEYFLGAISPDAVHMREDYKREYKTASHFGIKNVGSLENIKDFLKIIENAKEDERKNFLKGYLVHLLTDKLWLDTLYEDVYLKNYESDAAPSLDIREAYYNDTDQIDLALYRKMPQRNGIFEMVEKAEIFGIDKVLRSENVYMWKVRTLNWFGSENRQYMPLKYIKYEDVIEFSKFASSKIEELLENLIS